MVSMEFFFTLDYSESYLKQSLKEKTKISFQDRLSLNAGQKYPLGHSAIILSTFTELQFAIKIFVLSIFEQDRFYFN